MPSECAIAMIAVVNARSSGSRSTSAMKLRSILTPSTGTRRRWLSPEKPVPKSSSHTLTPVARRRDSSALAWTSSPITAVSVNSRCRRIGGQPGVGEAFGDDLRQVAAAQLARRDVDRDEQSVRPMRWPRCQRTASRHAVRSTCGPSVSISPLCSATSMNTDGAITPCCGCCQRSSASAPHHRTVGEAVHRLVHHAELAAVPGAAQLVLQAARGAPPPGPSRGCRSGSSSCRRPWPGTSRCRRSSSARSRRKHPRGTA